MHIISSVLVKLYLVYLSCMLLTIESDVDLIITCLMPKSLCLGWSCETGPSRNITTVMVFQNSTQIVTLQHRVCQRRMVYSLCRNINNYTMNPQVLCAFPLSISFFHLFSFFSQVFCCFNALFFLCVCQMGLLCGQVFRQETGSSRYCVHLPP